MEKVIAMKRCLACLLCLLLCITALPVSAAEVSTPSPWAEAEVNEAISIGLVPEELQSDYQQDITRDEFAQLAVTLCMAQLRYVGSPEQFLEDYRRYFRDEAGNTVDAVPAEFSDATFWGTVASALGIVQGRGNGPFDPDGFIIRREAGPHGEVSTEWGIRTELEISHNDEKAVHWIEREHRTLQLI